MRKATGILTFEPGCWRPDCQKRILFWSKTSKSRTCSGVKLQKFGACSGFLEVKNRPWSVAHTRIPDIRKSPPSRVAHNCHGILKFTAANSNSPRQIRIHHVKLKFTIANSNSPRQIQIHHGKFKFFTGANSNSSPGQIKIHHVKLKFTTTNSNSLRQIQIHCGKFKFTTANLPR